MNTDDGDLGVILLCVFNDETLVSRIGLSDCFSGLVGRIYGQWPHIQGHELNLTYSILDIPRCVLNNDDDFANMQSLAKSFRIERIRVDIFTKQLVHSSVEESNHHSQAIIEEGYEDDVLASFFPSQKKSLKTLGWEKTVSYVGQKFEGGAKEFRESLLKCSVEAGFEFKFSRNDPKRIKAVCAFKETHGCQWFVYATMEICNGFFYIRKLNNVHSCGASFRCLKRKRMGSNIISSLIIDKVRKDANIRPIDIVKDFALDYGLNIEYMRAWSGLEKAKTAVLGDQSESFEMTPRYVEDAIAANPGSHIILDVDQVSQRFLRIFVSFNASIDGINHCRPTLYLDGTHLKGKFKGHLLAATGKDGNNGLYPFAFAVVNAEDEVNWTWFLSHLRIILDPSRTFTFLSDRHFGLLAAVKKIFPGAPHGFCLNHLKMNLKERFRGKVYSKDLRKRVVSLFTRCAYAPSADFFDLHMENFLKEGGEDARSFVENLPLENWANAFFVGKRFGEMCSNASESFNNWILKERELPITNMIDSIRIKMMKMFYDRRELCKSWNGELCPAIDKKIALMMDEARTMPVVRSVNQMFEIQSNPVVVVDLAWQTCTCRVWQINGLPCVHAVACILIEGKWPISKYVRDCFHVASYSRAYERAIYPVVNVYREGNMSNDLCILPPLTKRMPGRPRKNRYLSRGEQSVRTITCSRCKTVGKHNKKTCSVVIS